MLQLLYENLHLLTHDHRGHCCISMRPDPPAQLGKATSAFSQNEDDLRPFCAQARQILLLLMLLQLKIGTFLLWKVEQKKKTTSHRMLKIHHKCLDLLVSEAVSNFSPSAVDSASSALKKHLGKSVHCCTNAWVFAHTHLSKQIRHKENVIPSFTY